MQTRRQELLERFGKGPDTGLRFRDVLAACDPRRTSVTVQRMTDKEPLLRRPACNSGQKKETRRAAFQKPKGTTEYCVESRDTLNSIALKFDTTPNALVQLNKLFSRAVVPGQILYVPDPDYVSSAESSPSLSPVGPLSPTSSEADLEKLTTDSDGAPQKDIPVPQVHIPPRSTRVVSSTSEEEEALTEKFLKINCKYITDGKGIISGVLLVTPNNIMFDPHRADPLVLERGCEEYGIMCPLEEIMSATAYKEISDVKIKESIPADLEALLSGSDPGPPKRPTRADIMGPCPQDTGNDSGSTAPRSTEGSVSEEVFTESELSPIREELPSSDELHLNKSSGASSESVQTINQVKAPEAKEPEAESSSLGNSQSAPPAGEADGVESGISKSQEGLGKEETQKVGADEGLQVKTEEEPQTSELKKELDQKQDAAGPSEVPESQEMAEGMEARGEKQRQQTHRFLCLRVGRPMKKTFVSQASASMQQYAQRGRKHEYWFTVPQERSDHLYLFFVQWSPETYGDRGVIQAQEPGFKVVKRNEHIGVSEEEKTDISTKEWEVVSEDEYQRRVDALNSEDLRALCKRLQITTKEELTTKHGTSNMAELELEALKPTLSEPSSLLQVEQIEKLAKTLPPRTFGYPWSLAFSTSKHGMSIKTLYRTMQAQDSPVLMIIKDSDGQLFGALASEPFKVSEGFYGTGETFLFTFCPELEVFKWTGDNMFFIKGDMDSLAFGGGGGEFGLWLDGDLYHGRSHSCKTFGNPLLSKKEDFFVQDIEIWSFE
ncbi:oxidation resistance protein 1-like isoform X2 [Paramormyrops kingsleyae]|uniref:oxidation resistance protein 1-like isoform X2 n=1 Tax=Paramormyrops kingsleyae TaxID=1676925 RepID=UPI000CD61D2F|nr:oxidation resistance protein 1-like isoform X2 [Paramormyrops kingsleyae]